MYQIWDGNLFLFYCKNKLEAMSYGDQGFAVFEETVDDPH